MIKKSLENDDLFTYSTEYDFILFSIQSILDSSRSFYRLKVSCEVICS